MSFSEQPWRSPRIEARATREALILHALQDLQITSRRSPSSRSTVEHVSRKPSIQDDDHPLLSPSLSSTKSYRPFYESPGYFYDQSIETIGNTVEGFSSGASNSASESASHLISDFFSDSGSFSSSVHLQLDASEAKLALWQAILVAVGYCQGAEGEVVRDVKTPSHFPQPPLPVPASLTACRKLIQENVFLNIVNFKKSQMKREPLLLFANKTEVQEYTKKYSRYIKLTKAKQDLLNPLLRNFKYTSDLPVVEEGKPEGDKKVEVGGIVKVVVVAIDRAALACSSSN